MEENYSLVDENSIDVVDEVETPAEKEFEAEPLDEVPSRKKAKKELKKERKRQKLRFKYLEKPDIKYRGPLSYRHLRMLAWVALAFTQMSTLNTISMLFFPDNTILGPIGTIGIEYLADLTVPLFMIATFATILNKNKTLKTALSFYFAAWLGVGLVFVLIYHRYVSGALTILKGTEYDASVYFGDKFGAKAERNVFADLLALTSFYFFLTYEPKKHFQGKKIFFFRSLLLIPLGVAFFSYYVKVQSNFDRVELPFEVYPFLTTKPPLLYFLFIGISVILKRKERLFKKIGATKKQFYSYTKTNRNSLYVSIRISLLLFIVSLIDILSLIAYIIFRLAKDPNPGDESFLIYFTDAGNYEIGQCMGVMIAIPVILLFSYNRKFEDRTADLIIPIIGIALFAWVNIEGIYQIIRRIFM